MGHAADFSPLAPYVTSLDSPVFALRNLPEEVVAVLFAYYSRSSGDLRSNLLRLIRDEDLALASPGAIPEDEEALALARQKAREFHEKWVVGYGHASVAEHAVAHVAVEQVSILVSKVIEDCRLASYTEKSTRYVPFPRAYYPAPELEGSDGESYRGAVEHLFDEYEALLPLVTERVTEVADRGQFKTERGFLNSCQAQACDALRYLLPAATHTNIGLTANARTLEHMISKLLSHPLAEAREVGERIKTEASKVIPTLIKYARRSDYAAETPGAIRRLAAELLAPTSSRSQAEDSPSLQGGGRGVGPSVHLVAGPAAGEAEARLAAAILYEVADRPYGTVWQGVRALSRERQRMVIEEYLARRRTYGTAPHTYTDPPLRCLEHVTFSFEIVCDFGAYRDIQRHRMATQTSPRLTCADGYETPELLVECGYGERFDGAMERAAEAYGSLAALHPGEAQYVVPLAFRKRVLFSWNLRELHHFVSLRSGRQGHPSYRRIAQEVYAELERAYPFLAQFIQVDQEEYAMARPG